MGLVRHQDRTPAREVSAMSVGRDAFAAVWARLSMGCQRQGSALHHSSADVLERARGGVAGIARSRSWWKCVGHKILGMYKLKIRDSRRRRREYYPRCATDEHRPGILYRPRGSLRVVLK